jgi:hypothetical protein
LFGTKIVWLEGDPGMQVDVRQYRTPFAMQVMLLSLAFSIPGWVIALPAAHAANATVLACPTILDSLHKDWRATQELVARYGSSAELNPLVRGVGPDPYFGIWTVTMAGLCQENQQWQYTSFFVWLVQTWAVNTHTATGTVAGFPLFMVQINIGQDFPPANTHRFHLTKARTPKQLVFKPPISDRLRPEE